VCGARSGESTKYKLVNCRRILEISTGANMLLIVGGSVGGVNMLFCVNY
jgi:hypothetical protein